MASTPVFTRGNPIKQYPAVTMGIIVVNVLVFLLTSANARGGLADQLVLDTTHPSLTSLVTYAFMHANLPHLFFNMLFLWIFGPNVEDLMGRKLYLGFYLACGVAAALMFMLTNSGNGLAGASGAIAGVMGAYFILFPWSQFRIFWIPMYAFWLIFIFMYQDIRSQLDYGGMSPVAYMAHIGGYILGAGVLYLLIKTRVLIVPLFDRVKHGEYALVTPDEELLEQVRLAQETKRFGPIADMYTQLLREMPEINFSAQEQSAIAKTMMQAQRPDLAVIAWRKIMEAHGNTPHALHAAIEVSRIASLYFSDPQGAIGYLQWVTQAAPQSPRAQEARGEIQKIQLANRYRLT